MLIEVAGILKATMRSYDLIIRCGDHEFICVISGMTRVDVSAMLEPINWALRQSSARGSVTIGLAELQPGDTVTDLIARAAGTATA